MQAIGIDLGGTKLAGGLVTSQGQILDQVTYPTDRTSQEAIFDQILALIQEILSQKQIKTQDLAGIGLGIPGKLDPQQGVTISQNNIPLGHFPLVARLQEVFPQVLIRIDNDVKVAALAEYHDFQAQPEEVFTYVTVSTGIASASLVGGQLIRGHGFSGEIGFLPVFEGKDQWQTLETVASGPGILKAGVKKLAGVQNLQTKDIFQLAQAGDRQAQDLLAETAQDLALGLYSQICVLDPAMIVLGGSVMNHNPAFVQQVLDRLSDFIVPEQAHILEAIHLSRLKGDNGLVGAARLVMA